MDGIRNVMAPGPSCAQPQASSATTRWAGGPPHRGRAVLPPGGRAFMAATSDTCPMGFNPHRVRQRTPSDYVMVIGAFVVVALLIAWALVG